MPCIEVMTLVICKLWLSMCMEMLVTLLVLNMCSKVINVNLPCLHVIKLFILCKFAFHCKGQILEFNCFGGHFDSSGKHSIFMQFLFLFKSNLQLQESSCEVTLCHLAFPIKGN